MVRSLRTVALLVAILACGDGVAEPSLLRGDLDALYGHWRWVRSCCGVSGSPETPESTGESRLLVVERPSTMRFYHDSDLLTVFDFAVRVERRAGRDVAWLMIEGEESGIELRLRSDTLEFIRTCPDCPSDRFERIPAGGGALLLRAMSRATAPR